jgi:hypothetical protein
VEKRTDRLVLPNTCDSVRQHGDHSDLIDELDRVVSEIEKFVRKSERTKSI